MCSPFIYSQSDIDKAVEDLRAKLAQAEAELEETHANAMQENMARVKAEAERDALKDKYRVLENAFIHLGALQEAIACAIDGEEVSDFMASCPLVDRAMLLRGEYEFVRDFADEVNEGRQEVILKNMELLRQRDKAQAALAATTDRDQEIIDLRGELEGLREGVESIRERWEANGDWSGLGKELRALADGEREEG